MSVRERELAHCILEVIDFSDNGIELLKIEEVLMSAVSFRAFVMTLNALRNHGLITIDANHVARRVRS